MSTYVLVPGFFFGPWVWEGVAHLLTSVGHQVKIVSLTGQGERVDQFGPEVGVGTHIDDIAEVIGDLDDMVLVLHSGATIAGTAVADRLPQQLRHVVYVDTAPLPDGMAQIDFLSPELQARQREQIQNEGEGRVLPPRAFDRHSRCWPGRAGRWSSCRRGTGRCSVAPRTWLRFCARSSAGADHAIGRAPRDVPFAGRSGLRTERRCPSQ